MLYPGLRQAARAWVTCSWGVPLGLASIYQISRAAAVAAAAVAAVAAANTEALGVVV